MEQLFLKKKSPISKVFKIVLKTPFLISIAIPKRTSHMNVRNAFYKGSFTCLSVFLGSTSSIAGNTWTEVYRKNLNWSDRDISGYVNYVDIDSIKERGDIVYFNWGTRTRNNDGFLRNGPPSTNDGKINCKDKTAYLTIENGSWVPLEEIENEFWIRSYPFVCKENKFKFWE